MIVFETCGADLPRRIGSDHFRGLRNQLLGASARSWWSGFYRGEPIWLRNGMEEYAEYAYLGLAGTSAWPGMRTPTGSSAGLLPMRSRRRSRSRAWRRRLKRTLSVSTRPAHRLPCQRLAGRSGGRDDVPRVLPAAAVVGRLAGDVRGRLRYDHRRLLRGLRAASTRGRSGDTASGPTSVWSQYSCSRARFRMRPGPRSSPSSRRRRSSSRGASVAVRWITPCTLPPTRHRRRSSS